MTQLVLSLINGIPADHVSVKDRAFNYGDGLFETIAVHGNQLHYWKEHYQRLLKGCQVLGFDAPLETDLLEQIRKLDFDADASVLKIVVSRGQGGRGYSTAGIDKTNIIITLYPWPDFVNTYQQQGITVRLCEHRLIINPALAGIKHLNRIDQVLARNEWHNDNIQEGLMLDADGCLLEGISSNLFIRINNQWITAAVKDCAVDGVIRNAVIVIAANNKVKIEERKIHQSELSSVQSMFVCNSIWGIVPVTACDSYRFEIGEHIKQFQMELEWEIEAQSYVF